MCRYSASVSVVTSLYSRNAVVSFCAVHYQYLRCVIGLSLSRNGQSKVQFIESPDASTADEQMWMFDMGAHSRHWLTFPGVQQTCASYSWCVQLVHYLEYRKCVVTSIFSWVQYDKVQQTDELYHASHAVLPLSWYGLMCWLVFHQETYMHVHTFTISSNLLAQYHMGTSLDELFNVVQKYIWTEV